MKLLCAVLGSVLLATLGASAQAQILIGQTSGFSGSSAVGAKGISDTSPAMLEGFAVAKVRVEALRRAWPTLNRWRKYRGLWFP